MTHRQSPPLGDMGQEGLQGRAAGLREQNRSGARSPEPGALTDHTAELLFARADHENPVQPGAGVEASPLSLSREERGGRRGGAGEGRQREEFRSHTALGSSATITIKG